MVGICVKTQTQSMVGIPTHHAQDALLCRMQHPIVRVIYPAVAYVQLLKKVRAGRSFTCVVPLQKVPKAPKHLLPHRMSVIKIYTHRVNIVRNQEAISRISFLA